jgi:hypothetical protein
MLLVSPNFQGFRLHLFFMKRYGEILVRSSSAHLLMHDATSGGKNSQANYYPIETETTCFFFSTWC